MRTVRFTLIFLAFALAFPSILWGSVSEIVEIETVEFYDGITVTSMKHASGNFTALVSDPGVLAIPGLEKKAPRSSLVRARFDLRIKARMGAWKVFDQGSQVVLERTFDYRATSNVEFLSRLDSILRDHTVDSVALSALLLYEEHLYEEDKVFQQFQSMAGMTEFEKVEREVCDGCTANDNGCSPSWVVPQTCGSLDLSDACGAHDACYQCGAFCSGASRLDCDRSFRNAIASGGSAICAEIYYWGVRALGWLFFQDPSVRPYMGPDVYEVGVQMSACEGQYAHMCTTYVM